MLRDLSCPKCGAAVTLENEREIVVCKSCGASSFLDGIDDRGELQLALYSPAKSDVDASLSAVSGTSLWKDAWRRLLKNKLAVFGMIVLGVMIVLVTIGPIVLRWLTGITADSYPTDGDLIKSFPPSLKHPMGTDEQGRDLFARVLQGGRISLTVGVITTIVALFVGVSYGAIAGYLGGKIDNLMMRFVDMLYAIPYILIVIVLLSVFGGPNTQVLIAALPAILAALIVGVVGVLVAVNIFRRIFGEGISLSVRDTLSRLGFGLLESALVIGLISLTAYLVSSTGFGSSVGARYGDVVSLGMSQIFLLFFALGLVSWLTMARVVRGQILSLKNQEFVLAAKATGVSTFGIIFRHLVPNALGPVIVYATLTVPSVMLTEAFLSYLGLGVQAPYASWGSLAADGVKNIAIFPWQLIFPGVTMALTLFSLNFLGDGLRDALDPQTRKF